MSRRPILTWVVAPNLALLLLLVVSGCVLVLRNMIPPHVDAVEPEELSGTWQGWEYSFITLHGDGTAEFTALDGYWFAFDEGWRLSGTGTWEIVETENWGPEVHVASTGITGATEAFDDHWLRLPKGHDWRSDEPPEKETWVFGLDREWGELRLWMYMSDPDSRYFNWFDRVDA